MNGIVLLMSMLFPASVFAAAQSAECRNALFGSSMEIYKMGEGQYLPFSFDEQGRTILRPNVRRSLENGVETLSFSVKGYGGKESTRQVIITRDRNGAVRKLSSVFNQEYGGGTYKSFDTEFVGEGEECRINQTLGVFEGPDKKETKRVYFDKKFCDDMQPQFLRMGRQNAAACVEVISQAKKTFNDRKNELSQEGKEFGLTRQPVATTTKGRARSTANEFDLFGALQSCAAVNGDMSSYYGNLGSGGAYGGGMSWGVSEGTSKKEEAKEKPQGQQR